MVGLNIGAERGQCESGSFMQDSERAKGVGQTPQPFRDYERMTAITHGSVDGLEGGIIEEIITQITPLSCMMYSSKDYVCSYKAEFRVKKSGVDRADGYGGQDVSDVEWMSGREVNQISQDYSMSFSHRSRSISDDDGSFGTKIEQL